VESTPKDAPAHAHVDEAGQHQGEQPDARAATPAPAADVATHNDPKSAAKASTTARRRRAARLLASPDLCTDTANAERFAAMHRARAKYVRQWAMWLVYDGRRWAKDPGGVRVGALAKETVRAIYGEAKKCTADPALRQALAAWASESEGKRLREAMTVLARSEQGMAVDFTDLDAHPDLLNVANGTLDLRKGELRPHNPADLLTKLAPVKYDARATCERFGAFLDEIMVGDKDSVEFLRRFLGYCLSGSIREHAMCFWYGEAGGNGKSTLAGVMFQVLGDYAIKSAPDLLFRSAKTERHPTELADLHGARLVVCNETAKTRTWDAALLKDITGGDPIKARHMHQDFWSFKPTHKLVVFGNNKPSIADTNDGGLKRRLRLVPFEASFTANPDKKLDATLRKEAPGILHYLVQGCLAWQRDGLTEPTTITEATADYFAEQDVIGRFVRERCDLNPLAKMPKRDLRLALERWAEEAGEEKPNAKDLTRWLGKEGIESTSVRDASNKPVDGWRGIRLKLEAQADKSTTSAQPAPAPPPAAAPPAPAPPAAPETRAEELFSDYLAAEGVGRAS
jgi:putative DNA primase/helicase